MVKLNVRFSRSKVILLVSSKIILIWPIQYNKSESVIMRLPVFNSPQLFIKPKCSSRIDMIGHVIYINRIKWISKFVAYICAIFKQSYPIWGLSVFNLLINKSIKKHSYEKRSRGLGNILRERQDLMSDGTYT